MAACRKVTVKERIAATERETGRKLTPSERVALDLIPQQWICTGTGVGGLRGGKLRSVRKPKRKARSATT